MNDSRNDELELSIVMPCLNEAESVGACVTKASTFLRTTGIRGEVIIADNGSSDDSIEIAESLGARVVRVEKKGYGAALTGGFNAASGRYMIMGDADNTYDFSNLMPFVQQFRQGADVVVGNRFIGGIEPGAMPPLHRYLGNPVLTGMARFLFGTPCGDVYCGLRGLSKSAFEKLELQSLGMEFALEMVAKSSQLGLNVAEVPTTLSLDHRTRTPHLKTWRDGRRSLRSYILFSPNWLLLYPGIVMMLLGTVAGAGILSTSAAIGSVHFSVHSLLYCAVAILLGLQAACFSVFTKIIAVSGHFTPPDSMLERFVKSVRSYHGLAVGAIFIGLGCVGSIYALTAWGRTGFGALDPFETMRVVIPSALSLALGLQVVLASLFLSLLKVQYLETGTHRRLRTSRVPATGTVQSRGVVTTRS